jgi:NACHT domain
MLMSDISSEFFNSFSHHVPKAAIFVLAALVVLATISPALQTIATACRALFSIARGLPVLRAARKPERQRLARRQRFADFLESRIRDLDTKEDWAEHRFTELEADVEVQNNRMRLALSLLPKRRSTITRERSLSVALARSRERLVLLQGEPGSGKSVALRQVARKKARRALHSPSLTSVIPLYVNLKTLEADGASVDADLIDRFVRTTITAKATHEVVDYFDREFARGTEAGTWLFLFDSFDEIPDILSSTEHDGVVGEYSDAIYNFSHGMRACRTVVASRYFRAPPSQGWPTFRILPLTPKRQIQLLKRTDPDGADERLLRAQLPLVESSLAELGTNPLFLSLLCDYVARLHRFPANVHEVFESYITQRLDGEVVRLQTRYHTTSGHVRLVAERVAYCMANDPALGLEPPRSRVVAAVQRLWSMSRDELERGMNALEFIRLARPDSADNLHANPFTFAHRRFQEYFATCLVLDGDQQISPNVLLTDGHWRETAVTLCQTRSDAASDLYRAAEVMLAAATEALGTARAASQGTGFSWPPHALHVLGILQSGSTPESVDLPSSLRSLADDILLYATEHGQIFDRKWALDVVGACSSTTRRDLIADGFGSSSEWLRETSFRQLARLRVIPDALARDIRLLLLSLLARGKLRRDRGTMRAQLMNLADAGQLRRCLALLAALPVIDAIGHILIIVIVLSALDRHASLLGLLVVTIAAAVSYVSLYPIAAELGSHNFRPEPSRRYRLERSRRYRLETTLPFMVRIQLIFVAAILVQPHARLVELVVLYLGLWPLASLGAVYEGRFVRIALWPLCPAALISPVYRVMKRVTRESALETVIVLAAIAGGVALLAGVGIAVYLLVPTYMRDILGALLAAMGLIGLLCVVYSVYGPLVIDWLWFRRWAANQPTVLSANEFVDAVRAQRGAGGAARFTSEVARRGLLARDQTVDAMLRELAKTISSPSRPETWSCEALEAWAHDKKRAMDIQLYSFGPSFLDVLGRLIEARSRS